MAQLHLGDYREIHQAHKALGPGRPPRLSKSAGEPPQSKRRCDHRASSYFAGRLDCVGFSTALLSPATSTLLARSDAPGGLVSNRPEIPLLAAGDESFRHGFKFLPPGANLFGFVPGDLVVIGRHGNDMQQVSEFLDDLVGGGDEEMGVRRVLGIFDEKAAGALANPLHEAMVARALEQGFDAVERVGGAAPGGVIRGLRPLIDHGQGEAEVGGDLFGGLFVKNLAEELVGLHGETMEK